jgi:hypothetical protein
MNRPLLTGAGATLLVLALAAGGWQWWRLKHVRPVSVATAPEVAPEPAPAAPASAALETPIRHPIESMPTLPPAGAPAATGADGVKAALENLLGTRMVASFLQTDGFIDKVVATVDNLDREHVARRLWPVNPTPGRFSVARSASGEVIATDNAQRYTPFVRFVEGIDTPRAIAFYVKLYPLFQQAYAELGYPRLYFNDRIVAVIDTLMATPMPSGPLAVQLVEVKGSVPSTQPWTRYEFVDPTLEALPAGQKLMLRMGTDNELRLKAKLAEFRRGIATGTLSR